MLNDDAVPEPSWLGALGQALASDPQLAGVQGTVLDGERDRVDGRGIEFDPFGLPIQIDRGLEAGDDPATERPIAAVSATAAMFRREALAAAALSGGQVFDESFGSYHEDVDLGLRLHRLGWSASWVPGARCRHVGSASGARLRWRHPWWLLANRWRALSGNFSRPALRRMMPRLLRGDLRAVVTLSRTNPRSPAVAIAVITVLPRLVSRGFARNTPGSRLEELPTGRRQ